MKEKKIHLLLAVLATGIMSFAGVLIETAMNVTFPTPDQAVRNLHRYGAVGHDHLSLSYLHYGAFFQLFIEKLFDSKIVYHRKSLFHYWINDRFVVTFLQYFVDWTLIARDQYRNCVTFDVPYYLKFHPYA